MNKEKITQEINCIIASDKNAVINIPERVEIVTPRGRICFRRFQIGKEPYTERYEENQRFLYERNVHYFLRDIEGIFEKSIIDKRNEHCCRVEFNVSESKLLKIINEWTG